MRIHEVRPLGGEPIVPASTPTEAAGFQSLLEAKLSAPGGLDFSRHALERLSQRSLSLDGPTLDRLTESVRRAESKGSRNALVLIGELAFVVSVEHHKVVTVADQTSLQDRVFTNIDSVVVG